MVDEGETTMLLGLETFSYHLALAYGKMTIFDFIRRRVRTWPGRC